MKMLVAGAVFAALLASPAWAQSYGPMHPAEPPNFNSAPYQSNGVDPRDGRTHSRTDPYSAYAADTLFGSPGVAGAGRTNPMSAAREAAVRACAAEARRYPQATWGNMDIHQYRTCMMQRGQAE